MINIYIYILGRQHLNTTNREKYPQKSNSTALTGTSLVQKRRQQYRQHIRANPVVKYIEYIYTHFYVNFTYFNSLKHFK